MFKYIIIRPREYIFIILTATIFSFISFHKTFAEESIFVIDNVKIEGTINLNFSRDKYIDRAFLNSFEILKSRILLSKDLNKIRNVKLNEIKNLINSFRITEESYRNNEYQATFKIFYNGIKLKKFLWQKNISFSQPKNISAVFFPTLFVNEKIKNFSENHFYQQWRNIEIKNETINYILPIEDLDDISKIRQMENRIEEIEIGDLVNKYDIKNYVFAFIDYNSKKLAVHLKTNFDNNKSSKNISYELNNYQDEKKLNLIIKDLKIQINDIWKEVNIINLSIPLTIRIKFQHANLQDLDKLSNTFYNISIIDNYSLEEFNINNSFYKIYYYGDPKRLKNEFSKFGYQLKNDQGKWELYING